MALHPLAGKPAPDDMLVNVAELLRAYSANQPDPALREQRVAFGTSGHRGSSFSTSFNEAHILAITQAICEYRAAQGIDGPLFLGMDTHALSEPAFASALEVLAAHGVAVHIDAAGEPTPTPVISHAILGHNRTGPGGKADGIVITPSHNPPTDGGFKYNPPHGGPAETAVTAWIEARANALLGGSAAGAGAAGAAGAGPLQAGTGTPEIRRLPYARALAAAHRVDFAAAYVRDLAAVVDLEAVRSAGIHLGVDPLGGASAAYWGRIASEYHLNLEVVNPKIDPTFRFMTLDWDGKIRMDCSSPYAMAGLVAHRQRFDLAFGNDADADRHGIVTRSGLMNPNHYLAVAVDYLFRQRPAWGAGAGVGKTLVSSSLIDRVAARLGRRLVEVPVGFKWFVPGLLQGSLGFAGEESAGASLLRRDGSVWSTDKDGMALCLLAAEISAKSGKDPSQLYADLIRELGEPFYERRDTKATREEKARLQALGPADLDATELAGEPIRAVLSRAPGNDAPIGGIKVVTENGWFAARPSGTEDVAKIYAESFRDRAHLQRLQDEAEALLARAFKRGAGAR